MSEYSSLANSKEPWSSKRAGESFQATAMSLRVRGSMTWGLSGMEHSRKSNLEHSRKSYGTF